MIEFGATLLLVTLSYTIFKLTDAITEWLDGVDTHRRAQAGSVLHHAGLLDTGDDD